MNIRQMEILEIARASGRVGVEELAERFDVTLQTIRRDLGELADHGMLDRIHGGAVMRSGVSNIGYAERRRMHEDAKAAIARACAARIPDNSSIIINLGTTTEAVARELLGHRNLTVITNNMNVANILVGNDSCEIVVAGGALRRSDGGQVGDLTTEFMAQFKPDYAIIGASALDADARDAFMRLLTELCEQHHTTLIFVSHDQSLSQYLDKSVALSAITTAAEASSC